MDGAMAALDLEQSVNNQDAMDRKFQEFFEPTIDNKGKASYQSPVRQLMEAPLVILMPDTYQPMGERSHLPDSAEQVDIPV